MYPVHVLFLCSLHSCTVLYVKLTVFDLITCMKYDKVYSAMAGILLFLFDIFVLFSRVPSGSYNQ